MDTRDADEQPARSPFQKRTDDNAHTVYSKPRASCGPGGNSGFRDRNSATGRREWDRLSGVVVFGQPTQGLAVVVIFPPMPGILGALVAFMREHQRCGELEGGRDEGYVWLASHVGPTSRTGRRANQQGTAGNVHRAVSWPVDTSPGRGSRSRALSSRRPPGFSSCRLVCPIAVKRTASRRRDRLAMIAPSTPSRREPRAPPPVSPS